MLKNQYTLRTDFTIHKNCDFTITTEIVSICNPNLHNSVVVIHKIKNKSSQSSFLKNIAPGSVSYPTRFSSRNYRKPKKKKKLHHYRFQIFIKGPAIWKELAGSTQK